MSVIQLLGEWKRIKFFVGWPSDIINVININGIICITISHALRTFIVIYQIGIAIYNMDGKWGYLT